MISSSFVEVVYELFYSVSSLYAELSYLAAPASYLSCTHNSGIDFFIYLSANKHSAQNAELLL